MITLLGTKEVRNNKFKNSTVLTLLLGFIFLPFYASFFMKLRLTPIRCLLILTIGIILPAITLLIFILELEIYNPILLSSMGVLIIGTGFYIFLRWIRQSLSESKGKKISGIYSICLNALALGVLTNGVVFLAISSDDYDSSLFGSVGFMIFVPYLLLLLFIWYFVH